MIIKCFAIKVIIPPNYWQNWLNYMCRRGFYPNCYNGKKCVERGAIATTEHWQTAFDIIILEEDDWKIIKDILILKHNRYIGNINECFKNGVVIFHKHFQQLLNKMTKKG
jgi:hypothetical protein